MRSGKMTFVLMGVALILTIAFVPAVAQRSTGDAPVKQRRAQPKSTKTHLTVAELEQKIARLQQENAALKQKLLLFAKKEGLHRTAD
jgi:hypothetical protein